MRMFALVLVWTWLSGTAEGRSRLIAPSRPVVAAPGQDVVLPCRLVPPLDARELTVEWSKPDLKPDPSDRLKRVRYLHLYRDRKEVPDMKIRSYAGRTGLSPDRLRHGDVSLRILNVTAADEGRYRCFVPTLRRQTKPAIIHLVVDRNFARTWTTVTPLPPRDPQTPDPRDLEEEGSGFGPWVVSACCLSLLLVALLGVGLCLLKKRLLLKRDLASHPEYEAAGTAPPPPWIGDSNLTQVDSA